VLAPFSETYYNSQPHIDLAQYLDLEVHVESLKQVLFKHSMTNIVGFCRTHKHMDLQNRERVVAFHDVTKNSLVFDYRVLSEEELETSTEYLIPYQFVYDPLSCDWIPLAYWDKRTPGGESIAKALDQLLKMPIFLEDLAKALKLLSSVSPSAIGLSLRFQHLVVGSEVGLLENTDTEARKQWMFVQEPTDSCVTTHWYWNAQEECHGLPKKLTCCCRQHKSSCRISCDPGVSGRHDRTHFN